jgi:ABC-type multidrug transport system fused ATPase/permease subunit
VAAQLLEDRVLETYRKILDLLTARERRRLYLLLVLIMVMGVAQMVGVASILPFLAVLAQPETVESNAHLARVNAMLGFTETRSFLMFLGGAVFVILVGTSVLKAVTQYSIFRFATMRGYSISRRLLAGYLARPYTWFLNRHSADLGANILTDVQKVISSALLPAMKLLSQGAVVLFLVTLLIVVNPFAAGVLALLLGGSYALIYLAVRNRLALVGGRRYRANQQRFQISGDAMAGIKDVKLLGLEQSYIRRFSWPARQIAEADALSAVIGEVPRYVLEAVAFGGLLLFVLFLLASGSGTLADIVPVLGVYAFSALRLFPALQQVYVSFTALRFSRPTLDKLHEDMTAIGLADPETPAAAAGAPRRKLHLAERLELEDVHYSYPAAERPALAGVDMAIPARSSVGIVGGTGAGKTTVVDVILGLLRPGQGALMVDGAAVAGADLRAWQNSIGYVPQQIFLTDDTVRANIAFGLDPRDVDPAAVERAARVAELHDFVMRELPAGYDTEVGERGVRLSGGQRQRIGIARALYHDPDVLILDEATSALDNLTERAVMEAVANLGRAKTVIMIAHRLTTVRNCDVIFMMERGRVVAQGSYDELLERNRAFQAMVAGGQG